MLQTTADRKTTRLRGSFRWHNLWPCMLISCPNCAAGYNVPDPMLEGAGRKLRCARCATEWQASLPVAEPVVEVAGPAPKPAPEPAPEPVVEEPSPEPVVPPPRPGRSFVMVAAIGGWVLSLAFLAGLGWAGLHWRGAVMATWPPSERLYSAIGVD